MLDRLARVLMVVKGREGEKIKLPPVRAGTGMEPMTEKKKRGKLLLTVPWNGMPLYLRVVVCRSSSFRVE